MHRSCSQCGAVARLHHHGLCDRCAAPKALELALTGPDGVVRRELMPLRDVLAASDPGSLPNWLRRSSATTLLAQLAATTGPVTQDS